MSIAPTPPLRTVVTIAAALCLGGCATFQTSPPDTLEKTVFASGTKPTGPGAGTTVVAYAAQVFAHDLSASATDAPDNLKALTAFRSGKALIDLQCGAYLDALGTANQRADNERKQISLIGGIAAAVGGLAQASAKEIAITASLFGFSGASMDAFTEAYLFSDAANSIAKLVRDAQAAYMQELGQDTLEQMDYPASVALLTGYESTCRPGEIRRLVDEAIAAARIVPETQGALSAGGETTLLLAGLMERTGRRVTESDAIALYAWFSNPSRRDLIKAQSDFLTGVLSAQGMTNDVLAGRLAPLFLPLSLKGNAVAGRWAAAVENVPGVRDAPAQATANGDRAAAPRKAAPPTAGDIRRAITITAPRVRVQQFR